MRAAAMGAVAMAVVLAGVGSQGIAGAVTGGHEYWLRTSGQFASPNVVLVPRVVTYDEELVPSDATIHVVQREAGHGMTVALAVRGVRPGYTFGTHVHTNPCGADPEAAGPHYQQVVGDAPALANPRNEVWLDFTSDEEGNGTAVSKQRWTFREGEARSVVLHEEATSTGDDGREPGDAGARVACFTVPFGEVPGLGRGPY